MSSSESEHAERPRLIRTRRGRLIGGVCSGLGTHFDVDPMLLRIAFVGLAFFAGIGIWLYLAILLLVPEEGASTAPVNLRRSSWRGILGVIALVVAAGAAISAIRHAAPGTLWAFGVGAGSIALVGTVAGLVWLRTRRRGGERARPSADRRLLSFVALGTAVVAGITLLALAGAWLAGIEPRLAAWTVLAVGVALILSAFTRARWLVLPALAFAVSVVIIMAAQVDLHGGVGDRIYRPRTLSQLRHGYRLGAGRLEVDLRDVGVPLRRDLATHPAGVGELVVVVPKDVCVAPVHASAEATSGRSAGVQGLDVDWRSPPLLAGAPTGAGRPRRARRAVRRRPSARWRLHPAPTAQRSVLGEGPSMNRAAEHHCAHRRAASSGSECSSCLMPSARSISDSRTWAADRRASEPILLATASRAAAAAAAAAAERRRQRLR